MRFEEVGKLGEGSFGVALRYGNPTMLPQAQEHEVSPLDFSAVVHTDLKLAHLLIENRSEL